MWLPSVNPRSFVRLRITGLSTLGVILISTMPDEPVWVYLGLRGTVTLVSPELVDEVLSLSHPLHGPAPKLLSPQSLT